MQDLIILGTGVHAFEMMEIVERINREKSRQVHNPSASC